MITCDTATQNKYIYSDNPESAFYRYITLSEVLRPLPSIFDDTSAGGAKPMPVIPVMEDVNEDVTSFIELDEFDLEESRDTWLNLASEDTLRKLWDTPEEDEAWRDLLKEI